MAPFERIRLLRQTGGSEASTWNTTKLVALNEGVAGFWRGNLVNVIRIFPARGVLFAANDLYKDVIFARFERGGGAAEPKSHPVWVMFSSGGLAGMTAIVTTYPLDVARTRLAGRMHTSGEPRAREHTSMTLLLYTMLRKEGIRSWYRGVGPTLLGALPYEGIKFTVYGFITETMLPRAQGDAVLLKLFAGAVAGTVAGIAMFPNDTVRKIMQMDGFADTGLRPPDSRPYSSAWDVWRRVYADHGVRRFYRGVLPYILRLVPGSAIQFGAYETLKQKQQQANLRRRASFAGS